VKQIRVELKKEQAVVHGGCKYGSTAMRSRTQSGRMEVRTCTVMGLEFQVTEGKEKRVLEWSGCGDV
jgi:hypothetical protein